MEQGLEEILMSNVLFLSVGRRVELVQAFKAELHSRGLSTKIFATDLRPSLSPACQIVDVAVSAPRVTELGYIDFLLDLCRKNSITLVIPTIDTELLLLALHREDFEAYGINIIISSSSLVSACRDKRKTSLFFKEHGIETPEIYERTKIKVPCFSKPFNGSCSVGALAITDKTMLTEALLADETIMFMELVDNSHAEFTVDAYYSRVGELICLVPRQRLEVRGGEVSKGVTRAGAVYDYLLPRMRGIEGARGCITLQIFVNEAVGSFYALEINPRFGGGFPLSYAARANYPGWLIDEYILGRSLSFFDSWERNLMMLRYDAKILVHDAV
jgi:carbamoyl-phosphate synthase large subunit